jgi:hypothetical protein
VLLNKSGFSPILPCTKVPRCRPRSCVSNRPLRPSTNERYLKLRLPSYFEQIEQLAGDLFTFVGHGARTSGEFLQKHFSDRVQIEHYEQFCSVLSRNSANERQFRSKSAGSFPQLSTLRRSNLASKSRRCRASINVVGESPSLTYAEVTVMICAPQCGQCLVAIAIPWSICPSDFRQLGHLGRKYRCI